MEEGNKKNSVKLWFLSMQEAVIRCHKLNDALFYELEITNVKVK